MSGNKRIRKAVRARQVELSEHAFEEMDADQLTLADVRAALMNGRIVQTVEDDPRGVRYVVQWVNQHGEAIEAVCRFLASGILWVITVYEVRETEDE